MYVCKIDKWLCNNLSEISVVEWRHRSKYCIYTYMNIISVHECACVYVWSCFIRHATPIDLFSGQEYRNQLKLNGITLNKLIIILQIIPTTIFSLYQNENKIKNLSMDWGKVIYWKLRLFFISSQGLSSSIDILFQNLNIWL